LLKEDAEQFLADVAPALADPRGDGCGQRPPSTTWVSAEVDMPSSQRFLMTDLTVENARSARSRRSGALPAARRPRRMDATLDPGSWRRRVPRSARRAQGDAEIGAMSDLEYAAPRAEASAFEPLMPYDVWATVSPPAADRCPVKTTPGVWPVGAG
jgi:hypothetical protein